MPAKKPDPPVQGMLGVMWDEQQKLNRMIFQKHGLGRWDPTRWTRNVRGTWISKFCRAMSHEVAELDDCTNWKWWSKEDKYDSQNALVELVDILHFWISACQIMRLEPEDIFSAYCEKNRVNHHRQFDGYVKKDPTDCLHIGGPPQCHGEDGRALPARACRPRSVKQPSSHSSRKSSPTTRRPHGSH